MVGYKTKWGVIGLMVSGILYGVHGFCPWEHLANIAVGMFMSSFALTLYGIYYRMVGMCHYWENGKPDVHRSRFAVQRGGGM